MVNNDGILVGGIPTPLKNMKVSWDDYAQYMKSHKSHVPKHQPEYVYIYITHIIVSHINPYKHVANFLVTPVGKGFSQEGYALRAFGKWSSAIWSKIT
jgi:hypothetical protein